MYRKIIIKYFIKKEVEKNVIVYNTITTITIVIIKTTQKVTE